VDLAFNSYSGGFAQVIIDECLKGWKELEYEVMYGGPTIKG